MARAIPGADLGETLRDGQSLAIRAGGHVAVDQRVSQFTARWPELCGQVAGEAALSGFATGCGCWSPRTRSCAGSATSSGAAGPPGPCAAGLAGHAPEYQGAGPPAGPGEPRVGLPQDPRGTGRPGSQGRGVDRMGDPQDQRHRPRAAGGRGQPGRSSCARRPTRSWLATSSPLTCSTASRPASWP